MNQVASKLKMSLATFNANKPDKVHVFSDTLPTPRNEIEAILQDSIKAGDTKARYCVTCGMYHQ